jgi:type IV pilus assembly protein PilN
MIRINLLPSARKQAKSASSGGGGGGNTPWFIAYAAGAAVAAVALLFVYLAYQSDLAQREAENAELERQVAVIQRQSADLENVRAQLAASHQLEEVVGELQRARFGPTRVMMELSRILSEAGGPTIDPRELEQLQHDNPLAGFNAGWDGRRLWLTAFEEEQRQVRILGVGRTNDDVAEFLRRLTLSDLFEAVALDKTEAATDATTHLDMIAFELSATVHY